MESDDGEDPLVRPYTITRGRTAPRRDDLTLITVVTTVEPDEARPAGRRLEPEHRAILELCREPAAVAEIAAELDLPVSVTKILIGDLAALGRVATRPPPAAERGGGMNVEILRAVRDGLQRL
ncbi:DUF742 domain-containing protein [Streptomyces taklimakanensis]|uniref:DUF742 domain-containing protein n=1 Tax=Streptomyces taklimakanensis TaxID=2569853 RepID=UPI0012BAF911|nr:DUF742 domain-containing protein [Streptomyces taklimakanensis]